MKGNATRILLVEDNPGDARLIREMLAEAEGASFEIDWAPQLAAGLEKLSRGEIDLVLLDLGLPDSRGLDTFVKAYAQAPQIPFVVLTGLDDQTLALSAVRKGAQDYLVKGQTDGEVLLRAIRYATERKRIEEELRLANEELSREIEERRAAELAVEAERQRLFSLLDGLPAMVSLIAPDFSLLFGNRVFGELFGSWQGKTLLRSNLRQRRALRSLSGGAGKGNPGLKRERDDHPKRPGFQYLQIPVHRCGRHLPGSEPGN